ncbi:MAG: para-aminobenzoate synthetase component [Candidatus Sumerlaeota bacterium]|nr:para-aminobenzoate synthetase component [Candidatus Sumerlaeota bacterium]
MTDSGSDSQLTPMPRRLQVPLVGQLPGSTVLWRSAEEGWSAPPLHLPSPLLILRVNPVEGSVVQTPEGDVVARHEDPAFMPFRWIQEILATLSDSARGTERRLFQAPVFPLAIVCAAYEYGRYFHPHEHCFPHAPQNDIDDLFVSFHCTGFVRKDERWSLVGRPPRAGTQWKGWEVPRRMAEWPPPPAFSIASSSSVVPLPDFSGTEIEPVPAMSSDSYHGAIAAIHRHLRAGDIYQANMTLRFEGKTSASADRIFAAGLRSGGDRFAACMRTSNCTHVSFSPELLMRKWGRSICTKPVKGTRARSPFESDHEVEEELATSAKDKAEHVMIVDLERNDLGRLCEYGTVRVDPMLSITRHPTLFHLESTVSGTLRASVDLRDVFSAIFPGGSVTGAPKRRALEVIAALENRPRGIYCGALGWIDHRGDCEFNLPIRTATLHDDHRLHLYGGGGIVADSRADDEWREIQHKIRFMREAVMKATDPSTLPPRR